MSAPKTPPELACFSSERVLSGATNAPCSISTLSRSSIVAPFACQPLSRAERKFIEDGISQCHRLDGRSVLEYRPAIVEVGCLPSAYGSSRVRIGESELVVGVKCEVFKISPSDPQDEGQIACSIDCSAAVDLELEGRGGQEAASHLAQLANSLCLGGTAVDRRQLCIVVGQLAWKIFVDVAVLNGGGGILDAISIGVRAALVNTTLPKINHFFELSEEKGEEIINFEVDERPEIGTLFPSEKVPICVTVGQVQGRFVWDMAPEEESCSSTRLTVAVDKTGKCSGFHKSGVSMMTIESIMTALQNSCRVGLLIHQRLTRSIANVKVS